MSALVAAGCLFPDYEVGPSLGGGRGGSAAAPSEAGPDGRDSSANEACGNGADDDGDGKVDCFDDDCAAAAECAGFCSEAAELPCDSVRSSQSTGAIGSTSRIGPPPYACNGAELGGPEYAYRIRPPPGKQVFVEVFGLSGDADVHVVDVASGTACDAAEDCTSAGSASSTALPEAVTFTALEGRDYFVVVDGAAPVDYSIAVQCSKPDGCIPALAIEAGQSISGTTALGSAPNVTQNQGTYSCAFGDRSPPEAAFLFTPAETGSYQIDLTDLGGSLDLFVIAGPDCGTTCATPTSVSNLSAQQPESIVFEATAATSYYIVVDGFGTGAFTLGVTRL